MPSARPTGRGVVAAASYEARRYGVRSAMSSSKAKKLCPGLKFVNCRFDVYKQVSASIHDIFHEYTDIIEPISLDEAFLDVTENFAGIELAVDIAREIKRKIRDRLSLVASAGVSYNKFLAKIASDYRKPDGLCVIPPQHALDFIAKARRELLGRRAQSLPQKCTTWAYIPAKTCANSPRANCGYISARPGRYTTTLRAASTTAPSRPHANASREGSSILSTMIFRPTKKSPRPPRDSWPN